MLLNPDRLAGRYSDDRSAEVMGKTVEFFENRGKGALKRDEHDRVWPMEFLDFVRRERIPATLLTPTGYGRDDCRWDTYRICETGEVLAFYGLPCNSAALARFAATGDMSGLKSGARSTAPLHRDLACALRARAPIGPERPSTANGRHQQHLRA
jgi:hypothetical protein